MSEIMEIHRQAMELAEQADSAKVTDPAKARELLRSAFEKERQVALDVAARKDFEPARSVLLRSAASLALECEEHEEVRRLVVLGLEGDPPIEIADELYSLLKPPRTQEPTVAISVSPPAKAPTVSQELLGLVQVIEPYMVSALAQVPEPARGLLINHYGLEVGGFVSDQIDTSRVAIHPRHEARLRDARLLFNSFLDALLENEKAKQVRQEHNVEQLVELIRESSRSDEIEKRVVIAQRQHQIKKSGRFVKGQTDIDRLTA